MLNRAERAREQHPEQWSGYHEAARVLLAALYGDDDVALTVERSVRAVELARADADTLVVPAMAVLAWSRLLAGEDDAALELARATEVHPDADRRPFGVVAALAVQAVVAAERENAVVAERLAGRALFEAARAGVLESTAAGCAHFAAALGALADGRPVDAERALHRAQTIEAAIDGGAMHAWVLATFARTLAARGRTRRAGLALEEARGVLAACIDPGAVAARVERAAAAVAAALEAAAPTVTEALSPAELSVLRHFEGDRTARAIGADLYVSINTVKTHIRAIYRKLGVSTREDALARAKALGLLDV
jgi:LuxR family maltose regulon positive regulatory protein